MPGNHLKGNGCPECAVYGFKKNKPAAFYILEIIHECKVSFLGYGVTNGFKQRLNRHIKNLKKKGYKIQKVHRYNYEYGSDALAFENKIKRFKNAHVYIPVSGFMTESIHWKYKDRFLDYVYRHMD